jgi:hypothetical protein
MQCWQEMFLTKMDLYGSQSRQSELLDAVRQATPESRRAFEEKCSPISFTVNIIAGGYEGAWVKAYALLEDGTVEYTYHEGGSEETKRIRLEAQQQEPAF